MLKILLGGSPCTFWSIMQKDRETKAEGQGWELFLNYCIAKEKYKPDYFIYENNKSASQEIKNMIQEHLNAPLYHINSALVSAQHRERFYVTNIPNITHPNDKKILIEDILYNEEIQPFDVSYSQTIQKSLPDLVNKYGYLPRMFNAYNRVEIKNKSHTLTTGSMVSSSCALLIFEPTNKPIHKVKNGLITIQRNIYPTLLPDGYCYIRKLSINEQRKLQTVPEWYKMSCSEAQNHKLLANGWTVDIISYLLSHIPDIKNQEVEVLSMYDGMSCGQIALKNLNVNIKNYYSYEIDKYAIQTTQENFPKTIQLGDAFSIRKKVSKEILHN